MALLKIGLIGYRNHSSRVIKAILLSKKIKNLICYCYKEEKIKNLIKLYNDSRITFTSNLNNFSDLDAFFITSPSSTHVKYLKKLIKFNKPIFCEKTGFVNLKEYQFLINLRERDKNKIYFNYNLLHSDFFTTFKKIYYNNKDKLIHFTIFAGNGIAYLNKFKKNWRLKSKNILERISGNIGVHYINFLMHFLGTPSELVVIEKKISSKTLVDTSIINIKFKNGASGSIILSYATPLIDDMIFLFSNKILKYSKNKLAIYQPRETFNKKGYFITPKKKKVYSFSNSTTEQSLRSSINYFLLKTLNKDKFEKKLFNSAVTTSKILLSAKIN